MYIVRLHKYGSTWHFFTENSAGGGSGSSHCGSKKVAVHQAVQHIPDGETVLLETYHEHRQVRADTFTKGRDL